MTPPEPYNDRLMKGIMFAVLIALIPGGVVGSATFAIMAFVPNRRVAEIA